MKKKHIGSTSKIVVRPAIVKFRTKSGETIAIKAYRTFSKRSRTMKP